jgi:hypothetical protein
VCYLAGSNISLVLDPEQDQQDDGQSDPPHVSPTLSLRANLLSSCNVHRLPALVISLEADFTKSEAEFLGEVDNQHEAGVK